MKTLVIYLLLIVGLGKEAGSLSQANASFAAGDYRQSILFYTEAFQQFPREGAIIRYNIGQCYARMDSHERALQYFHLAITAIDPALSSQASNNIGAILVGQEKYEDALKAFREALVKHPDNEQARFNYELLLKRMRPADQQSEQNAPQPPPSTEENQQQTQAPLPKIPEAEYQELIRKIKLRWTKPPRNDDKGRPVIDTISLNQARSILERMRRQETQFLQQLRKTAIKAPAKNDEPDW